MSFDVAVKVESLSKCYQIYDQPRDRLKQFVLPYIQRSLGLQQKKYCHDFWALKNVSFEIKKGETLGIIGRNGSGKSTLLQMICGTLAPTTGQVEVYGRVAALLELGAGFNPEFTGRENIFLYASIFGMSESETAAKLDDILAFADIGDFVGQPVKTYSSGMFVRLAFAVAIHVDPQILVVDEALSVGDLAFQNKCIRKISELRCSGVTLLFVAHDLSILQMLCDRVLWVDRGEFRMIGDAVSVCQEYYVESTGHNKSVTQKVITQKETGLASFVEVGVEGVAAGAATPVSSRRVNSLLLQGARKRTTGAQCLHAEHFSLGWRLVNRTN